MSLLMRRRELMQSGGGEDKGWESGVKYDWSDKLIPNVYILTTNGKESAYSSWSATDFLPCHGVRYLQRGAFMSIYNAFYDENKSFIRSFGLGGDNSTVDVPANAYYFRLSDTTSKMNNADRYIIPYE